MKKLRKNCISTFEGKRVLNCIYLEIKTDSMGEGVHYHKIFTTEDGIRYNVATYNKWGWESTRPYIRCYDGDFCKWEIGSDGEYKNYETKEHIENVYKPLEKYEKFKQILESAILVETETSILQWQKQEKKDNNLKDLCELLEKA